MNNLPTIGDTRGFGVLTRAMDINMDELPFVVYACFVLHNFCEINGEWIGEDKVAASMEYERNFQPVTASNNFRTECNEAEGRKIKRILTRFFDHWTKQTDYCDNKL